MASTGEGVITPAIPPHPVRPLKTRLAIYLTFDSLVAGEVLEKNNPSMVELFPSQSFTTLLLSLVYWL